MFRYSAKRFLPSREAFLPRKVCIAAAQAVVSRGEKVANLSEDHSAKKMPRVSTLPILQDVVERALCESGLSLTDLDGIVAVVDAVNLTHQLGTLEACRQIGCADAIILNKMDALSSTTKHVSTPGEDIALAEGEATKAVSPMTTDADPCQAALDPPLITESHTAETNLSLEMLMSELRILNEMAPVYQATRSCGALAWLHLL